MGASALGSGLQGYFGGQGAKSAARIQSQGADRSRALLEKFFGQATQAQQPYLQAGGQGLEAFSQRALQGGFGTDVPQFQRQQFNIEDDPGYQFRLQQGTEAINRRASAGGRPLGGGVLKELMGYGQGLASEEADRAYGRYSQDRGFDYGMMGDEYNRNVQQQGIDAQMLQYLSGMGQQAAGNVGSIATGLGTGLADIETQRANAMAAGTAGQYNALGSFFGGLGSNASGLFNLGAMGGFSPQPTFTGGGGMGGMTQPPPMGYRPQLGQTRYWGG